MGNVLTYIKDMMSDSHGNPSSKRWIAIIAMILVCIGYIANLFWHFTIEQFIFDGVMYIVLGSLGITGAEKFAPKPPTDSAE